MNLDSDNQSLEENPWTDASIVNLPPSDMVATLEELKKVSNYIEDKVAMPQDGGEITEEQMAIIIANSNLVSIEPVTEEQASSLKKDVAKRKARKKEREKEIELENIEKALEETNVNWSEAHELYGLLFSGLAEYSNIGLAAQTVMSLLDAEKQKLMTSTLTSFYRDITAFSNKLTAIFRRIKPHNQKTTTDDLMEFYSIYEDLDALRVDFTTTLTEPSITLTEIVETLRATTAVVEEANA